MHKANHVHQIIQINFHTLVPLAISSSLNSIRAVPKLINARSTGSFS
jgi:hypothetical protein